MGIGSSSAKPSVHVSNPAEIPYLRPQQRWIARNAHPYSHALDGRAKSVRLGPVVLASFGFLVLGAPIILYFQSDSLPMAGVVTEAGPQSSTVEDAPARMPLSGGQSIVVPGSGNIVNQSSEANITSNNPPQQLRMGEQTRRRLLLEKLRTSWIASHDNISSKMMVGIEWPPEEWLNQKLADMGEAWRVSRATGDRIWAYEVAVEASVVPSQ